jgi:ankyrin repeat protein
MAAAADASMISFPTVISGKNLEVHLNHDEQKKIICKVFDRVTKKMASRFLNEFEEEIILKYPLNDIKFEQIILPSGCSDLSTRAFPMIVMLHRDYRHIKGWYIQNYDKVDIRLVEKDMRYRWIISDVINNLTFVIEAGKIDEKTLPKFQKEHSLQVINTSNGLNVQFFPYLYTWKLKNVSSKLIRHENQLFAIDESSGKMWKTLLKIDNGSIEHNIKSKITQHQFLELDKRKMGYCLYKWDIDDIEVNLLASSNNELRFEMLLNDGIQFIIKPDSLGGISLKTYLKQNSDNFFEIISGNPPQFLIGDEKDCLKKWSLIDGTEIKLFYDKKLKCEINLVIGKKFVYELECPKEKKLSDYVKQVKNQNPFFRNNDHEWEAPPQEIKKLTFVDYVSKLDDQIELTATQFAITAVRNDSGNNMGGNRGVQDYRGSVMSWIGHASLIIEFIVDDVDYFKSFFKKNLIQPLEKKIKFLEAKLRSKEQEMTYLKKDSEDYIGRMKEKIKISSKIIKFQRYLTKASNDIKTGEHIMLRTHLTEEDGVSLEMVDFDISSFSGKSRTWNKNTAEGKKLLDFIISSKQYVNYNSTGASGPSLKSLITEGNPSKKCHQSCISLILAFLEEVSIKLELTSTLRVVKKAIPTPADYIPSIPKLCFAVIKGQKEVMIELLKNRSDIEETYHNMTPIQFAVIKGYEDIVSILVDNKANINILALYDSSLIHFAAEHGHLEIIKFLVSKGLDIDSVNLFYLTPLYFAIVNGHKNIVEFFIANGAKINKIFEKYKGVFSKSCLLIAASKGYEDIFELLITNKINVNISDELSPIHEASGKGHKDLVALLITNGANVNEVDTNGDTPLHYAAKKGQKHVLKFLLANGAEVNKKNKFGITPLHLAVGLGDREITELLIENQGSIDSKSEIEDYSGSTYASDNKLPYIDKNFTALHIASQNGKVW